MSEQSKAALTTLNNNNVVNQTTPQSITPAILGSNVLQNIIDSMWNRVDDLLTLPPANVTKAALATAIGASSLNDRTNGFSDKQWLQITDRTDGYPLFVQITGVATISPFGIWVKSGKPLAVIMDYVNGYQGETNPFIAVFDENRQLNIPNKIIIADSSKGAGKLLVSDANGQGTWTDPDFGSGTFNPSLSGLVNIASIAFYAAQYIRVGNVVTVSGKVIIDPISTLTLTQIESTLPIASDFANEFELAGSGASTTSSPCEPIAIKANTSTNKAQINYFPVSTGSNDFFYSYTYLII